MASNEHITYNDDLNEVILINDFIKSDIDTDNLLSEVDGLLASTESENLYESNLEADKTLINIEQEVNNDDNLITTSSLSSIRYKLPTSFSHSKIINLHEAIKTNKHTCMVIDNNESFKLCKNTKDDNMLLVETINAVSDKSYKQTNFGKLTEINKDADNDINLNDMSLIHKYDVNYHTLGNINEAKRSLEENISIPIKCNLFKNNDIIQDNLSNNKTSILHTQFQVGQNLNLLTAKKNLHTLKTHTDKLNLIDSNIQANIKPKMENIIQNTDITVTNFQISDVLEKNYSPMISDVVLKTTENKHLFYTSTPSNKKLPHDSFTNNVKKIDFNSVKSNGKNKISILNISDILHSHVSQNSSSSIEDVDNVTVLSNVTVHRKQQITEQLQDVEDIEKTLTCIKKSSLVSCSKSYGSENKLPYDIKQATKPLDDLSKNNLNNDCNKILTLSDFIHKKELIKKDDLIKDEDLVNKSILKKIKNQNIINKPKDKQQNNKNVICFNKNNTSINCGKEETVTKGKRKRRKKSNSASKERKELQNKKIKLDLELENKSCKQTPKRGNEVLNTKIKNHNGKIILKRPSFTRNYNEGQSSVAIQNSKEIQIRKLNNSKTGSVLLDKSMKLSTSQKSFKVDISAERVKESSIKENKLNNNNDYSLSGVLDIESFTRILFDPEETADCTDPRWQEIKDLETNEDYFKSVRLQWHSLALPNPHKDLTKRYIKNPPVKSVNKYYDPQNKAISLESYYNKRIKKLSDNINTLTREKEKYRVTARNYRKIIDDIEKTKNEIHLMKKNKEEINQINMFYYERNAGWDARYLTSNQLEDATMQITLIEALNKFYNK